MTVENWGGDHEDFSVPTVPPIKTILPSGSKFYYTMTVLVAGLATYTPTILTVPVGKRLEITFLSISCSASCIQGVSLRGYVGATPYAFFISHFDTNATWTFRPELIFPIEPGTNLEARFINNDPLARTFYLTLYGIYTTP